MDAGGAHYPGADVSVAIVDTGTINHSALYPRVYDVHYIDVNWYRWNFWIWPRYVYVAQLYHIDSTSDWEYCEDWNPEHDYLDEDSILYQKKGIYDGYQTPGWDYGHGTGVTGALLRMAPFLGTWQGGQLILVDIIDCPYLDELADLWPRKEAWELGLYALNYWFDPNVVSISYGDPSSSFLVDEIDDLQSDGRTVVVAAAGNDDKEDVVYPAALENVVAVGAVYARSPQPPEVPIAWVDEDDYGVRVTEGAGVEWGSNYGPEIEVMGPGRFVWTFGGTPYTNWVKMEGTSVATPIVAGVFALVFQAYYYEHGQFPLSDVARELVEFHCDPGGQDTDNFDTDDTSTRQNNYYGYGIVDAWEALNAVGPTC
ncbi:MAG: S8/S53 family peptidase [Promethearchaeota archaeon]